MKGYLIKDFCILAGQKKLWIIYLVLAVFLGFNMGGEFLSAYIPMIVVMVALSTISYDVHDNGMAYLMTMPGGRKTYVSEKYLFSVLLSLASWALGMALQIGVLAIKKEPVVYSELFANNLLSIPIIFILCALYIPIVLKHGPEKGRLVLFLVVGVFLALVIGGKKGMEVLLDKSSMDRIGITQGWEQVPPALLVCGTLAVSTLILGVSLGISNRIMKRKEF